MPSECWSSLPGPRAGPALIQCWARLLRPTQSYTTPPSTHKGSLPQASWGLGGHTDGQESAGQGLRGGQGQQQSGWWDQGWTVTPQRSRSQPRTAWTPLPWWGGSRCCPSCCSLDLSRMERRDRTRGAAKERTGVVDWRDALAHNSRLFQASSATSLLLKSRHKKEVGRSLTPFTSPNCSALALLGLAPSAACSRALPHGGPRVPPALSGGGGRGSAARAKSGQTWRGSASHPETSLHLFQCCPSSVRSKKAPLHDSFSTSAFMAWRDPQKTARMRQSRTACVETAAVKDQDHTFCLC